MAMGYANTADNLAPLVPDYLDAFRLSHDPFDISPADEPVFYPGAQREAILDQVAHLSQFSASVVVVAGESGSGRTTLKDLLQLHLQDRYLIANVGASAVGTPQQVFAEMATVLDCEVSADASTGELISAIRSGLQQLQREPERGDTLLLLLDDAHWLSDAVLSALLSLSQAADPEQVLPFQMVLFGDLDLIDRLDSFGMVDILLHDVLLPPFSEDEMAEYLAFRLEAAGWVGELPFTDAEVERLHALAHGLPGAAHQPARELLIDKAVQEQETGPVSAPPAGLPVAHIFSLVVLVGVLLMAFFYRDSWLGPDDEPAATAGAAANSGSAASANGAGIVTARQGTAIRLPMAQDNATASNAATPPSQALGRTPATPLAAGTQHSEPTSAPAAESESSPAAAGAATVGSNAVTPLRRDTVSASATDASGSSAATVTATPSASPASVPAAPASAPAPSGSADERHLLSLPGDNYLLQIMASGSKKAVDDYLEGQKNRSSLFLYTSRRDGKPWYVVVTGNYSSVEMARAGVESLPVEQKKAGPWPRKISDVQSQIKEFRDI